uniref:ZAD domain-containing protein n=1 Tax=Anopheles farauti TaxID=69004 RepID=A0A182QUM9_9DIPT
MANTVQEITHICRFCLSDDEECLSRIAETVDASLSIEDIERFTGIQLHSDELLTYAICTTCSSKLRKSAIFRCSCIQNDTIFLELCAEQLPHNGIDSDSTDIKERFLKTTIYEIEVIDPDEGSICTQEEIEERLDDQLDCDENLLDENFVTDDLHTNTATKKPSNKSTASKSANLPKAKVRTRKCEAESDNKHRQSVKSERVKQLCVMCDKN